MITHQSVSHVHVDNTSGSETSSATHHHEDHNEAHEAHDFHAGLVHHISHIFENTDHSDHHPDDHFFITQDISFKRIRNLSNTYFLAIDEECMHISRVDEESLQSPPHLGTLLSLLRSNTPLRAPPSFC